MYSLANYGGMISDRARTDAYARALERVVRPESVVLDIGTGTGIFALLACRHGARRVFAVEPSDVIAVAREIAAANGYSDRIEFFQAASADISIPEPADIIVSDLRGIMPTFQSHIRDIADARRRMLAPGGTLIPRSDTLWVAVVLAEREFDRLTKPWTDSYDLDMSAARNLATQDWSRIVIERERIAAGPKCWATLDYRVLDEPDVEGEARMTVTRAGTAHGLCVWFDTTLIEGVSFSNAPGAGAVAYGNVFFPWLEPVALAPGDEVTVNLKANLVGDHYIWRWESCIVDASSHQVKRRFRQSEFFGMPLSPASMSKRAAGHRPALGEEGRIDLVILEMMEEGIALGEIATRVAGRFPRRFPTWRDALARAGELSARYDS
jgi:protein arginine N-methyltransferase 1